MHHKNTKIQNVKGKKILKTTILPNIGADIADVIIISRYGERLDLLSNEHYGTPSYWWIIAEANGIGKGSLAIPTGKQLRIPMNTEEIVNDFNQKVQDRVV